MPEPLTFFSLTIEAQQPDVIDVSVEMPYPGATCESEEDKSAMIDQFSSKMTENSGHLGCNTTYKCTFSDFNVRLHC